MPLDSPGPAFIHPQPVVQCGHRPATLWDPPHAIDRFWIALDGLHSTGCTRWVALIGLHSAAHRLRPSLHRIDLGDMGVPHETHSEHIRFPVCRRAWPCLLGHGSLVVHCVDKIAAVTGLSRDHMSKVLQRLSRVGIVRSVRGPGGGFQVVARPDQIRLIDVYEAIEGPFAPASGRKCDHECAFSTCPFGRIVNRVTNEVGDYLASTTLADLIEQSMAASETGEP